MLNAAVALAVATRSPIAPPLRRLTETADGRLASLPTQHTHDFKNLRPTPRVPCKHPTVAAICVTMAAFDAIEFFGVALDRDVVIHHESSKVPRRDSVDAESCISFDSIDVNEKRQVLPICHFCLPHRTQTMLRRVVALSGSNLGCSVTCRPWFWSATPPPAAAGPPSPGSSFEHLIPEDYFLHLDSASPPAEVAHGLSTLDYAEKEHGEESRDPPPLRWYKTTEERHERIAYRMSSVVAPCAVPYIDFVPFPGSGPGSPALSDATVVIDETDIAELPPPPLPLDTVLSPRTPEFPPRLSEESEGPLTLTRYLADLTEPQEWLAVVMQDGSQAPDDHLGVDFRQETPVSSITLSGGTAARNAVEDNDNSNRNGSEGHGTHNDRDDHDVQINPRSRGGNHDDNDSSSVISVDDNADSFYPTETVQHKRSGSIFDGEDTEESLHEGDSSSRVRLGGVLTYEQLQEPFGIVLGENGARSLTVLGSSVTKRSERVLRNNLLRTVRTVRMRSGGSSPPHKKPKTA